MRPVQAEETNHRALGMRLIPVLCDSSPISLRFWDSARLIQDLDWIRLTTIGHIRVESFPRFQFAQSNQILPPLPSRDRDGSILIASSVLTEILMTSRSDIFRNLRVVTSKISQYASSRLFFLFSWKTCISRSFQRSSGTCRFVVGRVMRMSRMTVVAIQIDLVEVHWT
jgi:hypothetical protein